MEALSGLRQVANTVQQIVDAVETVRRNKEECRELAKRVKTVGALLTQIEDDPDMMQNTATRGALNEMEVILRNVYELVMACQERKIIYRFIMGKRQAAKLREAKEKISFQLLVFPVVGHVHTTRLLRRIQNIPAHAAQPEDAEQVGLANLSQEDAEEVVSSYSSPQHDARLDATDETERAPADDEPSNLPKMPRVSQWFTIFTYRQLKRATDNFSVIIGECGFGTVYKGTLRDGLPVAVKRCRYANRYFANELLGGKLQHINISKLLGYCTTKGESFLVHEFMSRGSLSEHIFGTADLVLPWQTRFQIVEGIAQGALYLHKHCRLRVVHSDLKPSNILLDDDWTPKINDFGISRMLPRSADEDLTDTVIGTMGYMAPEYMHRGCFSVKTDVYSFGVMLLEIITGNKCYQAGRDNFLIEWVWERWNARKLTECIDPRLGDAADASKIKEMKRCMHIALLCVQDDPAQRPTMSGVLRMLCDTKLKLPTPQQRNNGSSVDVAEISAQSSPQMSPR